MKISEGKDDMRIKVDDDYGLFTIYISDGVLQVTPTERRFLFSFEEGMKVLEDLELCISKAKKEIHLFAKGVQ